METFGKAIVGNECQGNDVVCYSRHGVALTIPWEVKETFNIYNYLS